MAECEKLFEEFSIGEHTDSLVQYLPGGPLFESTNEQSTNLRKFFAGLAFEIKRLEDFANGISVEHNINCTEALINEWESAVGIPDSCFPGTGDLETRRNHVLIKLSSLGVSTAQGFIDLAALFGFKALIPSAATYAIFPLHFPAAFYSSPMQARYTMLVYIDISEAPEVFPFVEFFPIPFYSNITNIIECLFKKLAPSNVRLVFKYTDL